MTLGPELRGRGVIARGHSVLDVREETRLAWFTSAGARLGLEVAFNARARLGVAGHLGVVLRGVELTAAGQRAAGFTGVQGGGTVALVLQP